MFSIKITNEQANYAWDLVTKNNIAHRGHFDGDKIKQYTGMLGQVVMADALKLERPTGTEGFDKGIDFLLYGTKLDLKTQGRDCEVRDDFVCNVIYSQTDYETETYAFASINKLTRVMTMIGIMSKDHLIIEYAPLDEGTVRTRTDGSEFKLGTSTYEVPVKDINITGPIDNWEDFDYRIKKHKYL